MAYAWTQEALADKARDIHELGRELYAQIGVMGTHLDKLGRSLTSAVGSYNKAIGSLETRVLVSARKFAEMEVSDRELTTPGPVSEAARPLTAAELITAEPEIGHPRDEAELLVEVAERREGCPVSCPRTAPAPRRVARGRQNRAIP